MSERSVFTFQTRLALDPEQSAVLVRYAELYNRGERSLFAAVQAGGTINDLKREFLPKFGLTARQFNAMRAGLDGKAASIKDRRPDLIEDLQTRIRKADRLIAKLTKSAPRSSKLHQKKRRHHGLAQRLAALKADQAAGDVRLCFGSRRLFRAQFALEANGYQDHDQWQADWRAARSSQFFVLGSKDETAGNQSCQGKIMPGNTIDLALRLPPALMTGDGSKHLELRGLRFPYGFAAIAAALASSQRIEAVSRDGKPIVKRTGTALSYRFVRDAKGWRVFISCEVATAAISSRSDLGAIGVDINADHLAVGNVDRFGNFIGARRHDLHTYRKSTDQTKALIGDLAKVLVGQALATGKPLVLEKLDFARKKAELEGSSRKAARMLSSFACNKVTSAIKSAASRAGVAVIEVNPAYTSTIGAINHAPARGISVHQGAATAIARRGLGLSERPTMRQGLVSFRNGDHVTFPLPARNRAKHVWSFWSGVRIRIKAAHVEHARWIKAKAKISPSQPGTNPPALCANRPTVVRSRGANRQQNCSADVMEDRIPW